MTAPLNTSPTFPLHWRAPRIGSSWRRGSGKLPACRKGPPCRSRNSQAFAGNRFASGAASGTIRLRSGAVLGGTGAVFGSSRLCGATHRFVRAAVPFIFLSSPACRPRPGSRAASGHCRVRRQPGAGPAGGLQRVLVQDPRFRILNRTHPGAALVHGENEWLNPVERFATARAGPTSRSSCSGPTTGFDMRGAAPRCASGPTSGAPPMPDGSRRFSTKARRRRAQGVLARATRRAQRDHTADMSLHQRDLAEVAAR